MNPEAPNATANATADATAGVPADVTADPVSATDRGAAAGPVGPEDEYLRTLEALRGQVVAAVTAAARLRHPQNGQPDIADFLADALASAAANLGGVDALLAGRPGSWEADFISRLLHGTVGWNEEMLLDHRTEPVVVHLNVPRLVEEQMWEAPIGDLQGQRPASYEDEVEAIYTRYEALADELEHRLDVAEDAGDDPERLRQRAEDEYAAMDAAQQREMRDVHAAWSSRYEQYAAAFTAAVHAAVDALADSQLGGLGLPVPVTVETVTDPDHPHLGFDHPSTSLEDEYQPHVDPIAARLWRRAVRAVPAPHTFTPTTPTATPATPTAQATPAAEATPEPPQPAQPVTDSGAVGGAVRGEER